MLNSKNTLLLQGMYYKGKYDEYKNVESGCCWIGFIYVTDTVESSSSCYADPDRVELRRGAAAGARQLAERPRADPAHVRRAVRGRGGGRDRGRERSRDRVRYRAGSASGTASELPLTMTVISIYISFKCHVMLFYIFLNF